MKLDFEKINSLKDIDIRYLKSNYIKLHYFGLGFIQLKIDETYRIHFYTKDLPKIINEEEIHNHRYDFESKILSGNLKQEIFEVVEVEKEKADFILEEESCDINRKVNSGIKYVKIDKTEEQSFNTGSRYFISHKVFHKIDSDNAVTFLKRSDYKKENAEVIRKIKSSKICPFSKQISEDILWNMIEEIFNKNKNSYYL